MKIKKLLITRIVGNRHACSLLIVIVLLFTEAGYSAIGPSALRPALQFSDMRREAIKSTQPPSIEGIISSIERIGRERIHGLEDFYLAGKTGEFKIAIRSGKTLEQILPEVFAVFREAALRVTKRSGKPMYISDEQMMAAIHLHYGKAVEMLPGEGKTLAIAMAVYLNALTGKGVHVHLFNDYLTKRDGENMGKIYDLLGLRVGVISNNATYVYDRRSPNIEIWIENLDKIYARKTAYECDITYGVKDEFIFDYLKDNAIYEPSERRQREEPPQIIIVDEGDNTLLDEGCDPLILSRGGTGFDPQIYKAIYDVSTKLKRGIDYTVRLLDETIEISGAGRQNALSYFDERRMLKNLYLDDDDKIRLLRHALKAHIFYEEGVHYVVGDKRVLAEDGRVNHSGFRQSSADRDAIIIVDGFTGRLKPSQVWGDHLHQFLQVKEGIDVTRPSFVSGVDTYQCYYRRMRKTSRLAAASGTIGNGSPELKDIYGLETISIPMQYPSLRKDTPPKDDFNTEKEKTEYVTQRILDINKKGNPLLVYVTSIKAAKDLSEGLKRIGVRSDVLDGRGLKDEPGIIEKAGQIGRVTIATKAAGRGIHIELGEGVKEIGGLAVIITYLNPSRRIDDQLRTRAGRRGLPGWTETYISKEDELFKRFGYGRTQQASENYYRRERKTIFMFDKELEKKREEFYSLRKSYLNSTAERKEIIERLKMIDESWGRFLTNLEYMKSTESFDGYCRIVEDRFAALKDYMGGVISGKIESKIRIIIPESMRSITGSAEVEAPFFETITKATEWLEVTYDGLRQHIRHTSKHLGHGGESRYYKVTFRVNGKATADRRLMHGDTLEIIPADSLEETLLALEASGGNQTEAAVKLHITQSGVSHRIKRITEAATEEGDTATLKRLNKALSFFTERTLLALEQSGGDRTRAAGILHIDRRTIAQRIRSIRKAATESNDIATLKRLDKLVSIATKAKKHAAGHAAKDRQPGLTDNLYRKAPRSCL